MKTLLTRTSALHALIVLAAVFLAASTSVLAQVEVRESQISATVPDHVAPATPILIAPANNSLLNTASPTFIWQESTDNVGVTSYSLSLDGSVLFSNIPTSATSNTQYSLSYNSGSGYFSLLPENLISNGTHTWKITAFDAAGNSTDSVTWTFTIDTRAPSFVISDIGDEEVGISAHDLDSVPDDPVRLSENEPLLTGTGEANSTVLVTITTPDRTEQATFTIGSDGTWQLQLGVLPRGEVVYLDFVIEDPAGNVSILEDVAILVIDDSASGQQTPLPDIGLPPPGASPGPTATPPVIIPPGGATPPSPPVIPDLSAREWHHRLLKIAEPLLPLSLKEIAQQELIRPPGGEPWYFAFLKIAAPILLLLPPLMGFRLFLYIFGGHLPLSNVPQLAVLAGLLPGRRRPTGMVFDSQTQEGVPYARVVFAGTATDGSEVSGQVVSDHRGLFVPPGLEEGDYIAAVDYPAGEFPSTEPRPGHLGYRDYYLGDKFHLSGNNSEHQLLIPLDLNGSEPPLSYRLAGSVRSGAAIPKMSFGLAAAITLFFPSVWNLGVLGAGLALWLAGKVRHRQLNRGTLIDTYRKPVQKAILRFFDAESGSTLLLTSSNENGRYALPQADGSGTGISLVKPGLKIADAKDPSAIIASQS